MSSPSRRSEPGRCRWTGRRRRSSTSRRPMLETAPADGRDVRPGAEGGRRGEELRRVAEVVRRRGSRVRRRSTCIGTPDLKLTSPRGRDGARLPDPRPDRAARGARRGGRRRPAAVRREARAARGEAAPRGAGRVARAGTGVGREGADGGLDGRDRARRAVRPQDAQHEHPRPRDDRGARRRPRVEGDRTTSSGRRRTWTWRARRSRSSTRRSRKRPRRSRRATTRPRRRSKRVSIAPKRGQVLVQSVVARMERSEASSPDGDLLRPWRGTRRSSPAACVRVVRTCGCAVTPDASNSVFNCCGVSWRSSFSANWRPASEICASPNVAPSKGSVLHADPARCRIGPDRDLLPVVQVHSLRTEGGAEILDGGHRCAAGSVRRAPRPAGRRASGSRPCCPNAPAASPPGAAHPLPPGSSRRPSDRSSPARTTTSPDPWSLRSCLLRAARSITASSNVMIRSGAAPCRQRAAGSPFSRHCSACCGSGGQPRHLTLRTRFMRSAGNPSAASRRVAAISAGTSPFGSGSPRTSP